MTDRELLELAAKAAVLDGEWGDVFDLGGDKVDCSDLFFVDEIPWSPLTDDGDALRLAVRLHLNLAITPFGPSALALERAWIHENCAAGDDLATATRRAIVRAAAEIGKEQP